MFLDYSYRRPHCFSLLASFVSSLFSNFFSSSSFTSTLLPLLENIFVHQRVRADIFPLVILCFDYVHYMYERKNLFIFSSFLFFNNSYFIISFFDPADADADADADGPAISLHFTPQPCHAPRCRCRRRTKLIIVLVSVILLLYYYYYILHITVYLYCTTLYCMHIR